MANRRRTVSVPGFGRPQPGYHIRETVSLAISRTDQKERRQSISGQRPPVLPDGRLQDRRRSNVPRLEKETETIRISFLS